MDKSTINKMQHQYWVTKQTVYRKLGKKEDECIVASDALLDAKLELFKSIQITSSTMNKILDRYQERICYLAQAQNEMGRFLKEHGKQDKTAAGKMMIQMGKSLIYSSQQEISFRPPLLRLYQEVETFRNRAVEDTGETISHMERNRTAYRASLNWMKNVSQELDPDTHKQMDKFRKVQSHVKKSKGQFDKLKLACLQKVDLLAAARCNMFSHALIQYQLSIIKTTAKNAKIFKTLANTFKGHQPFEFSFVKELAEPKQPRSIKGEEKTSKEAPEELLFDFGEEINLNNSDPNSSSSHKKTGGESEGTLLQLDEMPLDQNQEQKIAEIISKKPKEEDDDLLTENPSDLLDNLLGSCDLSPETEKAMDALDLKDLGVLGPDMSLFSKVGGGGGSGKESNSLKMKKDKKEKSEKEMDDLLCDDIDNMDTNDTMTLLNEILTASNNPSSILSPIGHIPEAAAGKSTQQQPGFTSTNLLSQATNSFLPSHLLDFENFDNNGSSTQDLLNFNSTPLTQPPLLPSNSKNIPHINKDGGSKSWYDIFADLDPIENPDSFGNKKEKEDANRYC